MLGEMNYFVFFGSAAFGSDFILCFFLGKPKNAECPGPSYEVGLFSCMKLTAEEAVRPLIAGDDGPTLRICSRQWNDLPQWIRSVVVDILIKSYFVMISCANS